MCVPIHAPNRFLQLLPHRSGWVVTIYATIITLQSLWGWYVWLAGADKYMSVLRRYLILHSLRLRIWKFGLMC